MNGFLSLCVKHRLPLVSDQYRCAEATVINILHMVASFGSATCFPGSLCLHDPLMSQQALFEMLISFFHFAVAGKSFKGAGTPFSLIFVQFFSQKITGIVLSPYNNGYSTLTGIYLPTLGLI